MEIVVAMPAIAQPMNEPWISVIGKNHRFISGEYGIKFAIRKTVWMFTLRLQSHQVHDVNHSDFEIGKMLAQKIYRGQCFQSRHITGAGHHDVRLASLIGAGPRPDAYTSR